MAALYTGLTRIRNETNRKDKIEQPPLVGSLEGRFYFSQ